MDGRQGQVLTLVNQKIPTQEVKSEELTVSRRENEINTFIGHAIEKGLPVETMERLFALHREAKADFAKEQFVSALSVFQKEIPVITKNKKVLNKDGRTIRYQYASLDSIAEQIKEPLTKNGLSYSWEVENKPGVIRATCKITHRFGHSEVSSFEIPIDTDGYMTAPQKYASALTYAKRYSLCNALGISTAEEDTDATDVGKEGVAKSPKSRIIFALRTLGHESKGWSQAEWSKQIKTLVKLDLTEKNLPEIADKLEILVAEKTQDEDSKVQ